MDLEVLEELGFSAFQKGIYRHLHASIFASLLSRGRALRAPHEGKTHPQLTGKVGNGRGSAGEMRKVLFAF